jgi:hypothetical protein
MCKHADWEGCGYCVADKEHAEVLVLHDKVEALEGAAERLRACMLHADWSNEVINDFLSMFDAEMEAALRGKGE